jgi:hypothetical protein
MPAAADAMGALIDLAERLIQLETDLGDVYFGYTRGNEVLDQAKTERSDLWSQIQQLGCEAVSTADRENRPIVERRVSDLVEACRQLQIAGHNQTIWKRLHGNEAQQKEADYVRGIMAVSNKVQEAIARLRLLMDVVRGAVLDAMDTTGQSAASEPPASGPPSEHTNRQPAVELTAEERCIQIYLRDPNQSLRQIARQAGCDASIPVRSEKLKRLRAANAGTIPKGSKTKAGDLEVEEEFER